MAIKGIKRFARRIGNRLGLMTDWSEPEQLEGRELPASWYDKTFGLWETYHCAYPQSPYYFLWTVIADRLRRAKIRKILEIGCGPAQLAALLIEQGVEQYVGLDFSPKAISMARSNLGSEPRVRFVVGDARASDLYESVEHEAVICTEVLEHIEDDLLVVSRFRAGKRCLCSVPNFLCEGHVRCFQDAAEVLSRYGPFFDDLDVTTLRHSRAGTQKFFLLDGLRNQRTLS